MLWCGKPLGGLHTLVLVCVPSLQVTEHGLHFGLTLTSGWAISGWPLQVGHFRLGHFRLSFGHFRLGPFQVGPFQVEVCPLQVRATSGWPLQVGAISG